MPSKVSLNKHQKAVKKRIIKIVRRLEDELGLDSWLQITHHFDAGFDGDNALDEDGNLGVFKTVATTTPLWKYRAATIKWHLSAATNQTDKELEAVAIHEYIHILLAPLTAFIPTGVIDMEEFVTESLMRFVARAMGMKNVH